MTSRIRIESFDRDCEPFDPKTAVKIGEGAFGIVYQGFVKEYTSTRTGQLRWPRTEVAIKTLKISPQTFEEKQNWMREISMAKRLRFPTLSRILYWDPQHFFSVSIRERDTLKNALNMAAKGTPLSWKNSQGETVTWDSTKRAIAAFGVAAGLCYIHEKENMIHRDLKPENVLLDENMLPVITDFGLARILPDDEKTIEALVGTPLYMAPEVSTGHYSTPVDVYSYGMLLYKLLTLEDPWPEGVSRNIPVMGFVSKVMQGARPPIHKHKDLPDEWKDLIERCWSDAPGDRPKMRGVVDCMMKIDFSVFDPEVNMDVFDAYRRALYEQLPKRA